MARSREAILADVRMVKEEKAALPALISDPDILKARQGDKDARLRALARELSRSQ
jgi:hypothetical protein